MIKRMFNSLKIWGKLTMICLSFSIPIVVLLWLMVKGINYDIRFAQLETFGDEYQRPLEKLLKAIPDSQFIASRYLEEKSPKLKERLDSVAIEIDNAFSALERVDQKVGLDLQFTDAGLYKRKRLHFRAGTVKAEWQDLKKTLDENKLTVSASDEKHWHLTSDIRTMITHMGDTSFLILDPDLDTYYTMSSTLLTLPQTQERIAHIRDEVWHMLKKGNLTQDDQIKAATFAAMLKETDLDVNITNTNTAITEDPNFYGVSTTLQANIPLALEDYAAKTKPLIDDLRGIAKGSGGVSADEFLDKAQTAVDASFTFWEKFIQEEDVMLNNRMSTFEHSKIMYYLYTLIALIVSLFIAFQITSNITEPLKQCVATLKAQANMDFSKKLDLQRSDEFGVMAGGVNKVADNVRSTMQDILKSAQSLTDSATSWASASMELSKGDNSPVVKAMVDSIKVVAKNAAELQKLGEKFKF